MRERPRKEEEATQFLSGWKEIAKYMGKGVRTIQRYERYMGLPVRRPAGKASGSVVAVRAELDGWVKASPIREGFHLRNASPESLSEASAIRSGVSELVQLRQQMSTLRLEMNKSLERLNESLHRLQGELENSRQEPSNLYSPQERDLLDSGPSGLFVFPVKYPKAS